MKSKITLLLVVLFSGVVLAQNGDKKYDLLQSNSTTKIVYDRVFGVSNATKPNTNSVSAVYFKQVYHELQRADFLERLPKFEFLKLKASQGFAKNQVPLSVLICDFESLKKDAASDNNVFLNANNQLESKANTAIFDIHQVALAAPLLSATNTNEVEFVLADELVFNTTSNTILSIEANFYDNKGWRKVVVNQSLKIAFLAYGEQKIDFKITLSNGQIINQTASFSTINNKSPNDTNTVSAITATIPYQGYDETQGFLGQAEYDVFLDNVNGVLDKPIFLLDAFDPGDTRNIPAIYALLNYGTAGQNLADELRNQGFDIIILNFPTYTRPSDSVVVDGGVDYIQRNAMVFVELINQINAQKVGVEKNVVVGPSMGGLIARYALRYMEMNGMTHDTRLSISVDTPHLGANVPLGFQHLFNYMAYGDVANTAMQPLVDGLLKSPASKEMMIDHFLAHLDGTNAYTFNTTANLTPVGAPNFRNAFQTELNTIGFPQTVRNVAIANGAANATTNGTPNAVVMDHTFDITATQRAIINLNFTPAANATNQVSRIQVQQSIFGFWATIYDSKAKSKSPTTSAGLDTAPGGKLDMTTIGGNVPANPLLDEFFLNLQAQFFDFVPTNSALSISNTTNWYQAVSTTSNIPFAAYYAPTENQDHVSLNAQNVAFALGEIILPLSTENNLFGELTVKNPIANRIEIFNTKTISNASVSVIDFSGKTIYEAKNQQFEGGFEIPIQLSAGVYFLNIKTATENCVRKLIKV